MQVGDRVGKCMDAEVLNNAIRAYARGPSDNDQKLVEYLQRTGHGECLQFVKGRVESIQGAVFDQIWNGPPVTQAQVKLKLTTYCHTHYPEISAVGIEAMMGWLGWMCWHEGLLAP